MIYIYHFSKNDIGNCMAYGGLLVLIGFLCAVLGIGGKAKFNMGALGTVSGSSGVILIIIGVVFLSAGI